MILELLSRWLPPRAPAAALLQAANDPALQLSLPLGPLPMAAHGADAGAKRLPLRAAGTPPLAALNRRAEVRSCRLPQHAPAPVLRLSHGPAAPLRAGLGKVAPAAARMPVDGARVLRCDPADQRRTVIAGSLREVCAALDRLAEAEAHSGSLPVR